MLVQLSQAEPWRLPGTVVQPGETAVAAARRALAAAGVPPDDLILHRLYRGPGWPEADQVALFVSREVSVPASSSGAGSACFFAPGALPEATEPGARRRIAEVLDGAEAAEDW
jgi:hypothetical protein